MNNEIENIVIDFLKIKCPIKKVRNKQRFVKTLFILNGVLDNSIRRYTFEKDNRHNEVMLGTLICVIDLVFGLPNVNQNIIAGKYLGF